MRVKATLAFLAQRRLPEADEVLLADLDPNSRDRIGLIWRDRPASTTSRVCIPRPSRG
jgi:hypothetical protein